MVPHMRTTLALIATLAAIVASSSGPAQAGERLFVVPPEAGVRPLAGVGWLPVRCSDGPVFNLYHGAIYDAPPAIYLGYAYRPYWRYTAWHVVPRTFVCAER
jgi:hypothetical protein